MSSVQAALVAGLSGFAVMALELTAVSLMAPYFGNSAYVWTNVIGVILLAMAFGAHLGGRLSEREEVHKSLAVVLGASALGCALVLLLIGPVCAWLVPQDIPLDTAMAALIRGSLVATALLFALPVLLAACASPMLVVALVRGGKKVGAAAGLVSATGTIGSLLGTFAASHLLRPLLGSRETVWICAALLACAALLCARGRVATTAIPVLLLLPLSGVFSAPLKPAPAGMEWVAEAETPYQYLQVLRGGAGAERRTVLKINEGLDSFHSVAYADTPFTKGRYYDYHSAAPYLAGDGQVPGDLRVLSLGEAAGTYGRIYRHLYPGLHFDGVEIDPKVTELGAAHFAAPEGGAGATYGLDARCFVGMSRTEYHVVLVDAYEQQIYIPPHVCSRQFFAATAELLRPGGVVSVNAGGLRADDPVIQAIASTMRAALGNCAMFQVPRSRNFVLCSRKGEPIVPQRLAEARSSDPAFQPILAELAQTDRWHQPLAGGVVLDDNQPYLDVLHERAYADRGTEPELLPMAGSESRETVEAEWRKLSAAQRHVEALAVLQQAGQEHATLRILAGNTRWSLRDPEGALLEYRAAERLGSTWSGLAGLLESVQQDIAERDRARGVATRNSWLALIALGALLAGFGLVQRRLGPA